MSKESGNVVDFPRCTNPAVGQSIALYEASVLAEPESRAFEKHVSECSYCAGELYDLSEVTEVFRADTRNLFESIRPRNWRSSSVNVAPPIPLPAWKVAACILISFLIGATFLWTPWFPVPSEEALFSLPGTPPMIEVATDSHARHYVAGLRYYQQRKFLEALREFELSSRYEGKSQQAAFFVGMSRLYQGDAQKASEDLQRSLQFAGKATESQIRWYLAAAEWKLHRRDQAIQHLKRIIQIGNGLKIKAEEALKKISSEENR
jgi:hypothetical protein